MRILVLSILSAIMVSSCGSVKRFVAPPFTDVDKILELKPGQTVEEVSEILRVPPYDVVHSYESQSMVLVYNYRLKDRTFVVPSRAVDNVTHNPDSQREGELWYNNNYREIFLLFNEGKLKSIFGERAFSEGVLIEALDDGVIAEQLKGDDLNAAEYLFLHDAYDTHRAYKESVKLDDDTRLTERKKLMEKVGLVVAALLGLTILGL